MIKLRISSWKLNQSIQQRCKYEIVALRSFKSQLPIRIPHLVETVFNLKENKSEWIREFGFKNHGKVVHLAGKKQDEISEPEKNKPNEEKLNHEKNDKKKEDEKKDEKDKKEDEDDESEDDDSKGSLLIPLFSMLKM